MRSSRVCKRTWILWLIWQAACSGCWVRCHLGDHSSFVGGSVVLSPVTFFNGRVDTQRRAQRDWGVFFFIFLFYCCGLAFVFFFFSPFELVILFFRHVRFMFSIFWAHFCAPRPKALCSEITWVCFSHIKRQRKLISTYFS